MRKSAKSLYILLLSVSFVLLSSAFRFGDSEPTTNSYISQQINVGNSSGRFSTKEQVIDWKSDLKLKYTDFKAKSKDISGYAIANTASGFGYNITDSAGQISGNIYVRFYCNRSWWKSDIIPNEKYEYVLKHEQLHFDICELFGRKLYKELLKLRDAGRLNSRNIKRLHSKLEKQYLNYQDKYDNETNHSINGVEQYYWSELVKKELELMSKYSDYSSF